MIDKFPKHFFATPNYASNDITGFFDKFIDDFFTLISTLLNLLDSIEIYGVGLLNILITFFIVGIIIPIILTVVRSRSVGYHREKGRQKRWEKDHPKKNGGKK